MTDDSSRFKPPSSPQCYQSYEFAEDRSTLSLSESHPTVIKRNGKAGREKEYTYRFSEHSFWIAERSSPILNICIVD